MTKRVFILGSTGSIGTSSIEVIQHLKSLDGDDTWHIVGLSAKSNAKLLHEQASLLDVDAIALQEEQPLQWKHSYHGALASSEMLRRHAKEGDLVIAAIVGFAGISPVLTAIECGCDIALANKESLVAGGKLVMEAVKCSGVKLIPVDSEHSAVFQVLHSGRHDEVSKIILTASGGALRGMSDHEIAHATVDQVLKHPTWSMGAKVTVDSASLMNKALELIEAHWLFDVGSDQLDTVIHPQSIVHGMVEFCDGSIIAQLSEPDMKLPIQYALTHPQRSDGCISSIDWSTISVLKFEPVDATKYPAISLAHAVIERGGTAGAIFNASNEVVVQAFLDHTLPFGSMGGIVESVLEKISISDHVEMESVIEADREARSCTLRMIASSTVRSY